MKAFNKNTTQRTNTAPNWRKDLYHTSDNESVDFFAWVRAGIK